MERGQDDYIGEDISQLEHCLQTADQARRADSEDEVRPVYYRFSLSLSHDLFHPPILSLSHQIDNEAYLLFIFE